jgi:hypothetical protein
MLNLPNPLGTAPGCAQLEVVCCWSARCPDLSYDECDRSRSKTINSRQEIDVECEVQKV